MGRMLVKGPALLRSAEGAASRLVLSPSACSEVGVSKPSWNTKKLRQRSEVNASIGEKCFVPLH